MSPHKSKNRVSKFLSFSVFPLGFYFFSFCCLTYPRILHFSSHFFSDDVDGFINIWNIWWINKAFTDLHQSPLFTDYIHFPHGTSLLAHGLNPFNGFLGIALQKILTLVQTYNFIIVFAFIVGGYGAFLLAFRVTRSYWGSIIAGFIFTFSSFHFAHTAGHMHMVSLEWIPFFLLFWFVFLERPSVLTGIASSLMLFFVLLCDYYYILYSLSAALFIYIWYAKKKQDLIFVFKKKYIFPLSAFFVGVLSTSAPLVIAISRFFAKNTILGTHNPKHFSLDLLAPIIPGGHWRFAEWTQFYWANLPGNINESSVHLGLSVILVLSIVFIKRKKIQIQSLGLWSFIFIFFLVLSMGPVLRVWGDEISGFILPYGLFELFFPFLKIGGIPVRMMVMVTLCASIIFAAGFNKIVRSSSKKRYLVVIVLVLLCFEYLPRPIRETKVDVPEYIEVLKRLPGKKGVIDMVSPPPYALYFQTIHEKPIAFGYCARYPEKVEENNKHIMQLIEQGQFFVLNRDFQFQYLISDKMIETSEKNPIRLIFEEGDIRIYDLKPTS